MAMRYQVFACKNVEVENKYGMTVIDQVNHTDIDCGTKDKAVKVAKELYDTGNYNYINIYYTHLQEAHCWYNPVYGFGPDAENWAEHFESIKQ